MKYAFKRKYSKKSKSSTSLSRRSAPSRLPAPTYLNPRDSAHKHVLTMSSSQTFGGGQIVLSANAGICQFSSAGFFSPNASLEFGMGSFNVKIGGTVAISVKSGNQGSLELIYDAWILEKVEVIVRVSNNAVDVGNAGTKLSLPTFGYSIDNDDSQNTTYENLMQYANFKSKQPTAESPIKTSFKPACTPVVYNSAGFSGYSRSFNQQIDMAYPNVPHYGLKLSLDGMANAFPAVDFGLVVFEVRQHLILLSSR